MTSEAAGIAVGVSGPVGSRWFRERGGMPSISLDAPSGRYLSFAEREEIALLKAQDHGVREIARRIGREPSTISRELRRNAATRSGKLKYRAGVAQWKAELAARRPKTAKLVANPQLREYVQERLAGQVRRADGTVVVGPSAATWKGRNKPRRQDRRWAVAWSPEQISHRLKVDFPDDESMRISPEAIYQALYIEGRGALKRDLVACLRTGRALRVPRARARSKPGAHVTSEVMISERPAEVEDRAVPGHWEGDLIIGLQRSAIGTVVERQTRFTMLIHLPREDGYGVNAPVKNGPALGGYGAVSMNKALASVRPGEFLTLLGPSGGGKTTTLNLIAGFDEATTGSIDIDHVNMVGVPPHKRDIGVVFQNYALFPHMTVSDNIAYPLVQRKVPKAERAERVAAALRSVSLTTHADRYPRQLSGGQQQRVALARALVFRPKLLLMDEPLGALDRALREELQLEIRRIHREAGSTAIYVTHDQEEALVLSDRIAVFNHGKIEQLGTPRELYDSPATLFVGRFLGESTVVSGRVAANEDDIVIVQGPNGSFRARGKAPTGSDVTVLVRPEKQQVVAAAPSGGGENWLECRLLDQIFVGATWKVRVELPDGDIGVIRSSTPAAPGVAIGDQVFVTWRADDGVLLVGRASPEEQRAMSSAAV